MPYPLPLVARYARLILRDSWERIAGFRPDLVPPRRMVEAIGGYDFCEVGQELYRLVLELGRLQTHQRILDVGCGVGRLAVPLTKYLRTGEYDGFDIYRAGIHWCRKQITPRFPQFRFTHLDVWNGHYNPRGRIQPEQLVFPYASASVDVAFASSVFTHLLPKAGDRYLAEIARVLKIGGRAVLSFFLLNPFSESQIEKGILTPAFQHRPEDFLAVDDPRDPEAAIAYDETVVGQAMAAHGLQLTEISYGAWTLRPQYISFQDFVVAERVAV